MVAKKIIIRLMEEFLGEYIINISPENLKVAVLRGKIKIENVQLDGDLIGSHVLSAVGLSGFAVLSCTAEKLRANIPWGRLEKDPTTFELSGIQLICVPLLPSNAAKIYGAGTKIDPKCTLRTRVKRAALARFERNFFSWRIPGEGPPRRNKDSGNDNRGGKLRRKRRDSGQNWDEQSVGNASTFTTDTRDASVAGNSVMSDNNQDISDAQKNAWREKLISKLFRNIEISINDIHVRCEVSERALVNDDQTTTTKSAPGVDTDADKRSFAFGVHSSSMKFKSANSQWQTGKNVDWKSDEKEENAPENRFKVVDIKNLALYWDDSPPVMVSESEILKFNNPQMSEHKVYTIIRSAMTKLRSHQDPGRITRQLLATGEQPNTKHAQSESALPKVPHSYILNESDLEVRIKFTLFDDSRSNVCSAEIMPLQVNLSFTPSQLRQRRLLEYTMIGQRRLDTMLHQRPTKRPTEDPKSWWKYAISCVMTCQTRRPWRDVKAIISKRSEYIGLIQKKHLKKRLNSQDRQLLLRLEDILPIETLLAFHLIALRNVVKYRERSLSPKKYKKGYDDDASTVADSPSVSSEYSRISRRSFIRSPNIRKHRSRSRKRGDDETSVVSQLENLSLNINEGQGRQIGLPRSPVSKAISAKAPKERFSPPKDKQSYSFEDNGSVAPSVQSNGVSMYFDFEDFNDFEDNANNSDSADEKSHMVKIICANSLVAYVSLIDNQNGSTLLDGEMQASLWAQLSPISGTALLFDISKSTCFGFANGEKIEFFDFIEGQNKKEEGKLEKEDGEVTVESEVTLPLELPSSFDEDGINLEEFIKTLSQTDLSLPPRGVPCRVLVGINETETEVQVASNGATLIYNSECLRGFMKSIFPSKKEENRSVYSTQLRNSATQTAHDAQVALISPRAMSIKVRIERPNFLIPVSRDETDGTLIVDGKSLQVHITKPEMRANLEIGFIASGLHADFYTSMDCKRFFDRANPKQDPQGCISVVKPFDLSLEMDRSGEGPTFKKEKNGVPYLQNRFVAMTFSTISINLIDVDVLAIAIGRWYASEILALKDKGKSFEQSDDSCSQQDIGAHVVKDDLIEDETTLTVDGIELFLNGHEIDTDGGKSTYVVNMSNIDALLCQRGTFGSFDFDIGHVSVIQQKASPSLLSKTDIPLLVCAPPKRLVSTQKKALNSALNLKLTKSSELQSNEFDITFGKLIVRMTPFSLSDCSRAVSRIIQSTKIISQEMERRVHYAMRSARTADSRDHSIVGNPTGATTVTGDLTAISSVTLNRYERDESMFLIKLASKDSTLQICLDHETDNLKPNIQISASMLLMFQSTENLDNSGVSVSHASFDNVWVSLVDGINVVPRKLKKCNPIIEPFGLEVRVGKSRSSLGAITQQEFRFYCESMNVTLEKHNIVYMASMAKIYASAVRTVRNSIQPKEKRVPFLTRDNLVTTKIHGQMQPWSITLMHKESNNSKSIPLIQATGTAGGRVEGLGGSINGDANIESSISYYSVNIEDWSLVTDLKTNVFIDQNEDKRFDFDVSLIDVMNINITSEMLYLLAKELHKRETEKIDTSVEKIRKPTLKIINDSGIDVYIARIEETTTSQNLVDDSNSLTDTVSMEPTGNILVKDGCDEMLKLSEENLKIAIMPVLTDEQENVLGELEPALDVPVTTKEQGSNVFNFTPKRMTARDEKNTLDPVFEYCFQNQRLRSAFNEASTLENGRDLLSSQVWSTSDQIYTQGVGNHWLYPYLEDDVPEWSDSTFSMTMDKDRSILPDNKWVWLNDWEVEVSGELGKEIDADGWDYSNSFYKFGKERQYFREGSVCRRRRWLRCRMLKRILSGKTAVPIPITLTWSNLDGQKVLHISSRFMIVNNVDMSLSFLGYNPSWQDDRVVASVKSGEKFSIPLVFSSVTHLSIAIQGKRGFHKTERFMILPTGHNSKRYIRSHMYLDSIKTTEEFLSSRALHFLVTIHLADNITRISIDPVVKVQNLLPFPLQFKLLEAAKQVQGDSNDFLQNEDNFNIEESKVDIGLEISSVRVDPSLNPYLSIRVPGYTWSPFQRIVNRLHNETSWKPDKFDASITAPNIMSTEEQRIGYTSLITLKSKDAGQDYLTVLLEVEPGHCPTLRIYAQYWISDISGFGLRFCDGSKDLLGTVLVESDDRRSYKRYKCNLNVTGHEWAVGKNGMCTYYTDERKVSIAVDLYKGDISGKPLRSIRSEWSSLLDISNVMPKTTFFVDETNSSKRYELCYEIENAPEPFGRTKIMKIYSRFHVVNLCKSALYIKQNLNDEEMSFIPPDGSIPFHWEDCKSTFTVHMSTNCVNWSSGKVSLDKIGITSLTLQDSSGIVTVLQVEVQLASKKDQGGVTILVWNSTDAHPLYCLKNSSSKTIICSQQRPNDESENELSNIEKDEENNILTSTFGCGGSSQVNSIASIVQSCQYNHYNEKKSTDFTAWVLKKGEEKHFGFDDPQNSHILEWTVQSRAPIKKEVIDVDSIGSFCVIVLPDGEEIGCVVRVLRSTKLIEFVDSTTSREKGSDLLEIMKNKVYENSLLRPERNEYLSRKTAFTFTFQTPSFEISVMDNYLTSQAGREILLLSCEKFFFYFARNYDGNEEIELKIHDCQIDNFLPRAQHQVLMSFRHDDTEPILHLSGVGRSSPDEIGTVYRYIAVRLLDARIALDRETVEYLVKYFKPLRSQNYILSKDPRDYIIRLTNDISEMNTADGLQSMNQTVNSKRVYIEEFHLHPAIVSLTFTQDWSFDTPTSQAPAFLHYLRVIPSISNAQLIFTSFVVSHVFESPVVIRDIIRSHYVSQMTQHALTLIGSLAILTGPADFLANIGTGVRDFFYEPINGLVHGPAQFIEGLENGSISLVRGVFVGVVRGAANMTGALNEGLVNLTDDNFIEERLAYQQNIRELTRNSTDLSISDILTFAGASVAHGWRSGALGLYEKPVQNFNKHGAPGFISGVGHALMDAFVKPIIGIGDGAILVMQHVTKGNGIDEVVLKQKRMRRALPRKVNGTLILPYDVDSANAQRIITGNGKSENAYLGHVQTKTFLIIAGDKFLQFLYSDRSHKEETYYWQEISHFHKKEEVLLYLTLFTRYGMKTKIIELDTADQLEKLFKLLAIKEGIMLNAKSSMVKDTSKEIASVIEELELPGMETKQAGYFFGSINSEDMVPDAIGEDEIQIVEDCYEHFGITGSDSNTFLSEIDEEAWLLIRAWKLKFSGMHSKACILAGFINSTKSDIQIKNGLLHEGGSPCCIIPSQGFDELNNVLKPGSAVIFFAWQRPPSYEHDGRIWLEVQTNTFVCSLINRKNAETKIEMMAGNDHECVVLERSIATWWSKFWILIK